MPSPIPIERIERHIYRKRFPDDFLFQLTRQELDGLMLQNATSSSGHGGRIKMPYAFTEHGAIMAASVLMIHRVDIHCYTGYPLCG
jgi:hypothetical protein